MIGCMAQSVGQNGTLAGRAGERRRRCSALELIKLIDKKTNRTVDESPYDVPSYSNRLLDAKVLGGGFGSAANVKLFEDVFQMVADGARADVGFLRDRLVGESLSQEHKNLRFASG